MLQLACLCVQDLTEGRGAFPALSRAVKDIWGELLPGEPSVLFCLFQAATSSHPCKPLCSQRTKHTEGALLAACLQLQPPTQTASPLHTAQPMCALGGVCV